MTRVQSVFFRTDEFSGIGLELEFEIRDRAFEICTISTNALRCKTFVELLQWVHHPIPTG